MNAPKATRRAYKLFRIKSGRLYPLFIDKGTATPVGVWLRAKHVPTKGYADRPGWHCGVLPTAPHLLQKNGKLAKDRVWAEVEIGDDVDWQAFLPPKGNRGLKFVPEGGHYRVRVPRVMGMEWLIAGEIRVVRVLTADEVKQIMRGRRPMTHEEIEAELDELFSGDHGYWSEHQDYPAADWQYEVANGDTRESYREWLYNKLSNQEAEA